MCLKFRSADYFSGAPQILNTDQDNLADESNRWCSSYLNSFQPPWLNFGLLKEFIALSSMPPLQL